MPTLTKHRWVADPAHQLLTAALEICRAPPRMGGTKVTEN